MKVDSKFWVGSAILMGAAIWIVLNLITLHTYPYPSCDEAFYSEAAFNLLESGKVALNSHLGYGLIDQTIVPVGRIFIASIAATQAIFGVSLWSSRLAALLVGLLISYLVYVAGKILYGRTTGVYAGLLFAFSWRTVLHSHFVRPEIWLAGGALLTFILLWRFIETSSVSNGFLAGLMAALNVDLHLSGLAFALAATLIMLAMFIRKRQAIPILYYALGGLVGLIYWLTTHFFGDTQTFTYQMFELYADQTISTISIWQRFATLGGLYWSEYIVRNGYLEVIPSAVLLAGLVYSIRDKRLSSKMLLSYHMISSILFVVITPSQRWYHMMLWLPLLTVMGAEFVFMLAEWLKPRIDIDLIQSNLRWLVPLPLIGILLAGNVYLFNKFSADRFGDYAERVNAAIVDEGSLLAPHQLWFYDHQKDFTASTAALFLSFEEQKPLLTQSDAERLFRDAKPQYVVLNPQWLCLDNEWDSYGVIEQTIKTECAVLKDARYFENTLHPDTAIYVCR